MQTLKKTSPLMRGQDVTIYQQLVTAAGYDCGAIDGRYGDKCVAACKAFQKAKGLVVDGICGPKTWEALQAQERRTLRKTSPLMQGADVTQCQQLLTAAGCDCGTIDGKYGDKTVAAVEAYQAGVGLSVDGICGKNTWAALDAGKKPTPAAEPKTEHFKVSEWRCKDGTEVPQQYYANLQRLMDKLEVLRKEVGNRPITIVSGYRTPAYNAKVDGAKQSQHMVATAADIRVSGMAASEVYKIADKVFADGGVGKYSTFTHVDVRGRRARW